MLILATWISVDRKSSFIEVKKHDSFANRSRYYYEQGKKAEQAGDLTSALESYQHSAKKNFYKSYNSLGTFALGKGGEEKNPKEAERYFTQGANAGHAPAMFNLGRLYERDELKTGDNLARALFWYEKARDADPAEGRYQDKVRTITKTLRSNRK